MAKVVNFMLYVSHHNFFLKVDDEYFYFSSLYAIKYSSNTYVDRVGVRWGKVNYFNGCEGYYESV